MNYDWQPKRLTDPPEEAHDDECLDEDCQGECIPVMVMEPDHPHYDRD